MSDKGVLAIGSWRSNAGLISDVAKLGYLDGQVCDLTYGEGGFWSIWQPASLVTNDRHRFNVDTTYDCRCTPFDSASFDAVVFDPPYKLGGTPASGEMDERYGTDVVRTRQEVLSLLAGGIAEACRLAKSYVLVKCQDQVSSGRVRWMTHAAQDVARALEWHQCDEFHLMGGRPQPNGTRQLHARRNHSTLLVFGK